MKPQIIHAAYTVKDLETSIEFYKKLGFSYAYDLKNDDGSIWLAYLANEHHQFIELFPAQPGETLPEKSGPFTHLCYKVDDAQEFGRELQNQGVDLWAGPKFVGIKCEVPLVAQRAKCNSLAFFIADPDGNDIEIMQYTPESLQLPY